MLVLVALAAALLFFVLDPLDLDLSIDDLAPSLVVRPDQADTPGEVASRALRLDHQDDLIAVPVQDDRSALGPYRGGRSSIAGDAPGPEGHAAPHGLLAAHDPDRHGLAGGVGRHRFDQAVHVDDRGAPDVEEDVLRLEPGGLGRAAVEDRGDRHPVVPVAHRDAHEASIVGRGRGLADVDRNEDGLAAVGEVHEAEPDGAGRPVGGRITRVPDPLEDGLLVDAPAFSHRLDEERLDPGEIGLQRPQDGGGTLGLRSLLLLVLSRSLRGDGELVELALQLDQRDRARVRGGADRESLRRTMADHAGTAARALHRRRRLEARGGVSEGRGAAEGEEDSCEEGSAHGLSLGVGGGRLAWVGALECRRRGSERNGDRPWRSEASWG